MKFERKFSFVSVLLLTLILGSFTTALAKASNDEDIRIVKINDDNFEKEIDENVEWSIEKLDQYLKMNDYYINAIELYRKYYNKYHGTNSIAEL